MSATGWRKASASNGNGGNNCVEVARTSGGNFAVRDSKNRRVVLIFTPAEWEAFTLGVAAGEFDFREGEQE